MLISIFWLTTSSPELLHGANASTQPLKVTIYSAQEDPNPTTIHLPNGLGEVLENLTHALYALGKAYQIPPLQLEDLTTEAPSPQSTSPPLSKGTVLKANEGHIKLFIRGKQVETLKINALPNTALFGGINRQITIFCPCLNRSAEGMIGQAYKKIIQQKLVKKRVLLHLITRALNAQIKEQIKKGSLLPPYILSTLKTFHIWDLDIEGLIILPANKLLTVAFCPVLSLTDYDTSTTQYIPLKNLDSSQLKDFLLYIPARYKGKNLVSLFRKFHPNNQKTVTQCISIARLPTTLSLNASDAYFFNGKELPLHFLGSLERYDPQIDENLPAILFDEPQPTTVKEAKTRIAQIEAYTNQAWIRIYNGENLMEDDEPLIYNPALFKSNYHFDYFLKTKIFLFGGKPISAKFQRGLGLLGALEPLQEVLDPWNQNHNKKIRAKDLLILNPSNTNIIALQKSLQQQNRSSIKRSEESFYQVFPYLADMIDNKAFNEVMSIQELKFFTSEKGNAELKRRIKGGVDLKEKEMKNVLNLNTPTQLKIIVKILQLPSKEKLRALQDLTIAEKEKQLRLICQNVIHQKRRMNQRTFGQLETFWEQLTQLNRQELSKKGKKNVLLKMAKKAIKINEKFVTPLKCFVLQSGEPIGEDSDSEDDGYRQKRLSSKKLLQNMAKLLHKSLIFETMHLQDMLKKENPNLKTIEKIIENIKMQELSFFVGTHPDFFAPLNAEKKGGAQHFKNLEQEEINLNYLQFFIKQVVLQNKNVITEQNKGWFSRDDTVITANKWNPLKEVFLDFLRKEFSEYNESPTSLQCFLEEAYVQRIRNRLARDAETNQEKYEMMKKLIAYINNEEIVKEIESKLWEIRQIKLLSLQGVVEYFKKYTQEEEKKLKSLEKKLKKNAPFPLKQLEEIAQEGEEIRIRGIQNAFFQKKLQKVSTLLKASEFNQRNQLQQLKNAVKSNNMRKLTMVAKRLDAIAFLEKINLLRQIGATQYDFLKNLKNLKQSISLEDESLEKRADMGELIHFGEWFTSLTALNDDELQELHTHISERNIMKSITLLSEARLRTVYEGVKKDMQKSIKRKCQEPQVSELRLYDQKMLNHIDKQKKIFTYSIPQTNHKIVLQEINHKKCFIGDKDQLELQCPLQKVGQKNTVSTPLGDFIWQEFLEKTKLIDANDKNHKIFDPKKDYLTINSPENVFVIEPQWLFVLPHRNVANYLFISSQVKIPRFKVNADHNRMLIVTHLLDKKVDYIPFTNYKGSHWQIYLDHLDKKYQNDELFVVEHGKLMLLNRSYDIQSFLLDKQLHLFVSPKKRPYLDDNVVDEFKEDDDIPISRKNPLLKASDEINFSLIVKKLGVLNIQNRVTKKIKEEFFTKKALQQCLPLQKEYYYVFYYTLLGEKSLTPLSFKKPLQLYALKNGTLSYRAFKSPDLTASWQKEKPIIYNHQLEPVAFQKITITFADSLGALTKAFTRKKNFQFSPKTLEKLLQKEFAPNKNLASKFLHFYGLNRLVDEKKLEKQNESYILKKDIALYIGYGIPVTLFDNFANPKEKKSQIIYLPIETQTQQQANNYLTKRYKKDTLYYRVRAQIYLPITKLKNSAQNKDICKTYYKNQPSTFTLKGLNENLTIHLGTLQEDNLKGIPSKILNYLTKHDTEKQYWTERKKEGAALYLKDGEGKIISSLEEYPLSEIAEPCPYDVGFRLTVKKLPKADDKAPKEVIVKTKKVNKKLLQKLIPLQKNYYYVFYYTFKGKNLLHPLFLSRPIATKELKDGTLYYREVREVDPNASWQQEKKVPSIYNAQLKEITFKKISLQLTTFQGQSTKACNREVNFAFTRKDLQALTQKMFTIESYLEDQYFQWANLDELVKKNKILKKEQNYILKKDLTLKVNYGIPVSVYNTSVGWSQGRVHLLPVDTENQQQANNYLQQKYPKKKLYYKYKKEIYLPITKLKNSAQDKAFRKFYYINQPSFLTLIKEKKEMKVSLGQIEENLLLGAGDKIINYFSKKIENRAYWEKMKNNGAEFYFEDFNGKLITEVQNRTLSKLPQPCKYDVGFRLFVKPVNGFGFDETQEVIVKEVTLNKRALKKLIPLAKKYYYTFYYTPKGGEPNTLLPFVLNTPTQNLKDGTLFYRGIKEVDPEAPWQKENEIPIIYSYQLNPLTFKKLTLTFAEPEEKRTKKFKREVNFTFTLKEIRALLRKSFNLNERYKNQYFQFSNLKDLVAQGAILEQDQTYTLKKDITLQVGYGIPVAIYNPSSVEQKTEPQTILIPANTQTQQEANRALKEKYQNDTLYYKPNPKSEIYLPLKRLANSDQLPQNTYYKNQPSFLTLQEQNKKTKINLGQLKNDTLENIDLFIINYLTIHGTEQLYWQQKKAIGAHFYFKDEKRQVITNLQGRTLSGLPNPCHYEVGFRLNITKLDAPQPLQGIRKTLTDNTLTKAALQKLIPLEKAYYYAFYYTLTGEKILHPFSFTNAPLEAQKLENATLSYREVKEINPNAPWQKEKVLPTIYSHTLEALTFKKITITFIDHIAQTTKAFKRKFPFTFTRKSLQILTQKEFNLQNYKQNKHFHYYGLDELVKNNKLLKQGLTYTLKEDIALKISYGIPITIYESLDMGSKPQTIFLPVRIQNQGEVNSYLAQKYQPYRLYYNVKNGIYLPILQMKKNVKNRNFYKTYYKNKNSFFTLKKGIKEVRVNLGELQTDQLQGIGVKIINYLSAYGREQAYWKKKKANGSHFYFKDTNGFPIMDLKKHTLLSLPHPTPFMLGFKLTVTKIVSPKVLKMEEKILEEETLNPKALQALIPLQKNCYYLFYYTLKGDNNLMPFSLVAPPLQAKSLDEGTLSYREIKNVNPLFPWEKEKNLHALYTHKLENVLIKAITITFQDAQGQLTKTFKREVNFPFTRKILQTLIRKEFNPDAYQKDQFFSFSSLDALVQQGKVDKKNDTYILKEDIALQVGYGIPVTIYDTMKNGAKAQTIYLPTSTQTQQDANFYLTKKYPNDRLFYKASATIYPPIREIENNAKNKALCATYYKNQPSSITLQRGKKEMKVIGELRSNRLEGVAHTIIHYLSTHGTEQPYWKKKQEQGAKFYFKDKNGKAITDLTDRTVSELIQPCTYEVGFRLTVKKIDALKGDQILEKTLEEETLNKKALQELLPLQENYYYAFYYTLKEENPNLLNPLSLRKPLLHAERLENATLSYREVKEVDPNAPWQKENLLPTIYNHKLEPLTFKKITLTFTDGEQQFTHAFKREINFTFTPNGLQALLRKTFNLDEKYENNYFHFPNLKDLVEQGALLQNNATYTLKEDIILQVGYGNLITLYNTYVLDQVPQGQPLFFPLAIQTQQQANSYLSKKYPQDTLYYRTNKTHEIYLPLAKMAAKPNEICKAYYKNQPSFFTLQREDEKTLLELGPLDNDSLEGVGSKIINYLSRHGGYYTPNYWQKKKEIGAHFYFKDAHGKVITDLKKHTLYTLPQPCTYEVGFRLTLNKIEASQNEKALTKTLEADTLNENILAKWLQPKEGHYYALFYTLKEDDPKTLRPFVFRHPIFQAQKLEGATIHYKTFQDVDQSPFWQGQNPLPSIYNHQFKPVSFKKAIIHHKRDATTAIYKEGINAKKLYEISAQEKVNPNQKGLYYKKESHSYHLLHANSPLPHTLPENLYLYSHTNQKVKKNADQKRVTFHILANYSLLEKCIYWTLWGLASSISQKKEKKFTFTFPEFIVKDNGEREFDHFLDALKEEKAIPPAIRTKLSEEEVILKEEGEELGDSFEMIKINNEKNPRLRAYIKDCNQKNHNIQRKRIPLKALSQMESDQADVYFLPTQTQKAETLEKNFFISSMIWIVPTLLGGGLYKLRSFKKRKKTAPLPPKKKKVQQIKERPRKLPKEQKEVKKNEKKSLPPKKEEPLKKIMRKPSNVFLPPF